MIRLTVFIRKGVVFSFLIFNRMDSLVSLFHERIQKVRNNLQNTFGFQFLTEQLSDSEPRYAIVFPEEVYANDELRQAIKRYTCCVFACHSLEMVEMKFKDSEQYEVDRCGSRFRTHFYDNILEFVVTIRLEPLHYGIGAPKIPTWSILTVDYDDFYAELASSIRFHTTENWAVLDSEDKDSHKARRSEQVLQKLQKWL